MTEHLFEEMFECGALREKAQTLLDAAQDYWDEYQKSAGRDAVIWLQGSDGELVIFTRGEYRDSIKGYISNLR